MKIFSSLHPLAALGIIGAVSGASAQQAGTSPQPADTPPQQVDPSKWKCSSCPYPKGTTGTVEGGAGYVSDSSQKFGDYTGLDKKGGFLVLDGSVSRRGDDGYYADVTASDLGLDNRRISGEAGREGIYSLNIGYAEIPRHLTQDARTPFLGSGGSVQTLPGGFPAGDTASMPLGTTLQPIDIGYKYKRFDLGGTFLAGQDWNARLSFRHDERDGTKPTSGSFFSTASQLVAPVNEKTDQVELAFNYATKRLQVSASYEFSSFRNDNAGLTWSNPFLPVTPGATTGQLALAPSNQFQQVRGTVGYDISPTIRVSGNVAWGRMTQNESFLPTTQNTLLAPTIPALPVTSLDGKVDTFNGGIKVTATPKEGLRLTGSYDRDVHDNRTPVNTFPIVSTDMFLQPGTRTNTPFSWTIDRFKFLGDYAGAGLPASMHLTGGIEYDQRDRTYQEVQSTREWTLWGKVAATPMENLSTSLRLDYSWRDNTVYGTQVWFPFVENPLLRKFNLADRKRTKLEGRLDYVINEKVTLGVTADYSNDDYNGTDIGLTSVKTASLATELAFAISEKTQARGFLQGQWARAEQQGSQAFAGPDWFGRVKDQFTMLGVGVKHLATEKLELGGDLTIARSRSETAVDFIGVPAFPAATTKMDGVKLYGVYKLKDNMSIVGSYEYQHYTSDDWIFQGIAPGTVPNLLALGIQPPNYSVNVFRVALRYRF